MVTIDQVSLHYGPRTIFDAISAQIRPHDRVGLVGPNGAGKTTLLKLLCGLDEPEAGRVQRARFVTVGYLPQEGLSAAGRTLFTEVEASCEGVLAARENLQAALARLESLEPSGAEYGETHDLVEEWRHRLEEMEAHKLRSKIETILFGLGFGRDDLERETGEFSGGWQMRIALAKLLLREPSLLLLDEPTNHLDLDSLRWLEKYLVGYDGAIVLVSHDRAFLDTIAQRTFALNRGRLDEYAGNYSFYEVESVRRQELELQAFKNQQREIEKTERFIERFRYKATKAAQVQSRIKALDKIERVEVEEADTRRIRFRFPPAPRSARTVLTLRGLDKSYGDRPIFRGLDLEIERGDRLAVVGVNGAGKSTLARVLAGVEPFQGGERIVGANVTVSYFAQHQADELDPERETLECLADGQPLEIRQRLRDLLGAFLFHGDDVFKRIRVLSGGEKSRVALVRMLLRPANCLVLDEPTNHLDMRSKEVLQEALAEYDGTLLVVSHDRFFLEPVTTKVLEVRPGGVRIFPGRMSEFIAKLEEEAAAQAARETAAAPVARPENPRERRRREAERRAQLAPLRQETRDCQARIEAMEERIRAAEAAMADPAFFKRGDATTADLRAYDQDKQRLPALWSRWEELEARLTELEREENASTSTSAP